MRRRLEVVLVVTVAIGLATVSACAVSDLDYVQDDRVEITTPRTNETVSVPFEVDWTVEDFEGRFAVFFDRSPMRRGQGVKALVPKDDGVCQADPTCPDAEWLAARGIYLTDDTNLSVTALPDLRTTGRDQDRHEVIIVLLDVDGERIRESAFIREFIVEREDK